MQGHVLFHFLLAGQPVALLTQAFGYQAEFNIIGLRQVGSFKPYPAFSALASPTANGGQADVVSCKREEKIAAFSEPDLVGVTDPRGRSG